MRYYGLVKPGAREAQLQNYLAKDELTAIILRVQSFIPLPIRKLRLTSLYEVMKSDRQQGN